MYWLQLMHALSHITLICTNDVVIAPPYIWGGSQMVWNTSSANASWEIPEDRVRYQTMLYYIIRGAFKKNGKSWSFGPTRGRRVSPNPNFLAKFPKTKFALQLFINVMKHTLHKWGGNISSIHNVIGPPGGPSKR